MANRALNDKEKAPEKSTEMNQTVQDTSKSRSMHSANHTTIQYQTKVL